MHRYVAGCEKGMVMNMSVKKEYEESKFPFSSIWMLLFFFFLSLNILNISYSLSAVEKVYELILFAALPVTAFLIRDREKDCREFMVVVLFLAAIWGLGLINPNVRKWNHSMILVGALGIFIAFLILANTILKSYLLRRKENRLERKVKYRTMLQKNVPLVIIAIVFLLLSWETFTEMPHLDSTLYYTRFNKLSTRFDYTFQNIFPDFCFCKHLSIGYALFVLLGEEIQSYTTLGVHLVNFGAALISGICLYRLFDHLYPEMKGFWKYFGTALYLFSPFVVGTLGYLNVDLPAIYFFVIMLSCMLRDKRITGLFAAYVFIFTKEPCVIYYCFFLLSLFLLQFSEQKQKSAGTFFRSIWIFIRYRLPELLLVVVWLLSYLFLILGKKAWGGTISFNADAESRGFGFMLENLIAKFKQIFVLNFNWIWVFVILISIAAGVILHKQKKDSDHFKLRICLYGTLAGVTLFNVFYQDLINPRYIALASVIVLLLGFDYMFTLVQLLSEKNAKAGKTGMIGSAMVFLLILVQSFVSIDPVSYLVFEPVPYYGDNMFISGYKRGAISERTIYNREYNYFDRIVAKILNAADYREGDLVFFAGHFPNPYGYQPLMAWDQKDRRLRTVENENTVVVDLDRVEIPEEKHPKRIIHILELEQDAGGNVCQTVSFRSMAVKYYIQESE